MDYLLENARELDKTCVLNVLHKSVVIVQSPEDVKTVFTTPSCYQKADVYDVMGDVGVGVGLLFAKAKMWYTQRRYFNASFHTHVVREKIPDMNIVSKKLVADYEKLCGKGYLDLLPINGIRTTELTMRSQFDISLDQDTISGIHELMEKIMHIWAVMSINYYSNTVVYNLKKWLKFEREDTKYINSFRDLIKPPLMEHLKSYDQEFEATKGQTPEEIMKIPESFGKKLFRMMYNNILDDKGFEDHIAVLSMAGSDTSAIAISNTILCLAMNPIVQEKSYQEIMNFIPPSDSEITVEEMGQLQYFDRVIKESLRIVPTVQVIGRHALEDVPIENGVIPKGTEILLPIINIHKNKSSWGEDSDVFDPDNFLPERVEARHRCSYIPFSIGLRNCIATKYAETFMKMVLIRLVRNYKFTTELKMKDLRYANGLTTILLNKHMVAIEKRSQTRT